MKIPVSSNWVCLLKPKYHSCQHRNAATEVNEFVSKPHYPVIEEDPLNKKNIVRKTKLAWFNKIENLPTVEQKLVELNMPKHFGYLCTILDDEMMQLNMEVFLKFSTRTHTVDGLPSSYYNGIDQDVDDAYSQLKDKMQELILFHFKDSDERNFNKSDKNSNKIQIGNFFMDLNNMFIQELAAERPHLENGSVDTKPRIEGFWFVGGYLRDDYSRKYRPSSYWGDDKFMTSPIRSKSRPGLVQRTRDPLPAVIPLDDSLVTAGEIPKDVYTPRTYGIATELRPVVILPGFLPAEVSQRHGHLFLHSREGFDKFCFQFGTKHMSNALQQKMIYSAFTQAFAYAFYQGASPVTDPPEPVTQQTIITDGQNWKFGLYQLNTTALYDAGGSKNNVLWTNEDMKLYDIIEGDQVKGFNEETFKTLLKMYLRPTELKKSIDVPGQIKFLKDHPASINYKEEFQKKLLDWLTERPHAILVPEIYMWERIYKIYFKKRPRDAKRRFFEIPWRVKPVSKVTRYDESLHFIPKPTRIEPKIRLKPRIDSELLFKHDIKTLRKYKHFDGDHIAYGSMNVRKLDAPADPYTKRLY